MITAWFAGIVLTLVFALFAPEILDKAILRFTKHKAGLEPFRIWWQARKGYVKRAIKIIAIVLIFGQTVGFQLFIFEEALQTTMFATWQAPAGGDRAALAATYRTILDQSWRFLYAVGWTNPLAFAPFKAYFESAEQWYINAYRTVP